MNASLISHPLHTLRIETRAARLGAASPRCLRQAQQQVLQQLVQVLVQLQQQPPPPDDSALRLARWSSTSILR